MRGVFDAAFLSTSLSDGSSAPTDVLGRDADEKFIDPPSHNPWAHVLIIVSIVGNVIAIAGAAYGGSARRNSRR